MIPRYLAITLACIGTWLLSDALYSFNCWLRDPRQTWLKDHWLRAFRGVLGISLIAIAIIA